MAVRRLAAEQPDHFAFTADNLAWAKKVIDRYPAGRQASAVIPLLWRAQEQNDGWVCEPAIRYIADMLGMPHIRVLEVATFYTMFQLQPVGKKAHIQVCGTTPCQLRGAEDLIRVCKSKIAAHAHDLSADGDFSWEEVECLGACVNAPMVQIFKDTYEDLTPESLEKLIEDIAAGREVTPGPQNGRRFSMPEGGATSLTEIEDDTAGALPMAHLVDGAEKASHAFAGASINGGGQDYDGVPVPAEAAVARVKDEVVARKAAEAAKASDRAGGHADRARRAGQTRGEGGDPRTGEARGRTAGAGKAGRAAAARPREGTGTAERTACGQRRRPETDQGHRPEDRGHPARAGRLPLRPDRGMDRGEQGLGRDQAEVQGPDRA
ncbi:NADH-quinone oxidoreductase subunit NuoE [Polymorphum gilvum]|uniref:NADH-quinone oxidoreductase, E subunit subfamily, putative n=1 Tax=Polymorphum gilvum (strain LMG 25793 / CGMCC 1.9160 / SL003B-26A1) TaxID=991905 RepID=F2IXZ4_POLGS|nr:NADH-quinone oxidoreductase, E subunit subfamily, putative [Polymorphum gilvum SL003B-26A1]